VDNERDYTSFKGVNDLFYAPNGLEAFYKKLECPYLSTLIDEQYEPDGPEILNSPQCFRIRKLVLERLQLFLQGQDDLERHEVLRRIQNEKNFQVKMFARLRMLKVLDFKGREEKFSCGTTAGYSADGSTFVLLLAADRLDYFESVLLFVYCSLDCVLTLGQIEQDRMLHLEAVLRDSHKSCLRPAHDLTLNELVSLT